MFSRFILILLFLSSALCFSQTKDSGAIRKTRLITEIKQSDRVESYYLGYGGAKSNLCLKVDSLFDVCSFNEIVTFYNDTSYVLKYYAYQYITIGNDSLALEKLKINIKDSTYLTYHISCMLGGEKFNEILVQEYARSIKYKYFYGGVIAVNHKIYRNGKPNKKNWRKKRNELIQLIKENNINPQQFKYLLD